MVWERVAKFESGALYAEMYLRQNQSRGNREKRERGETGRKGNGRPLPSLSSNCDRSKDETRRKIRQRKKKNARVTKQIDEIVHRSLNGEREREKTWLGRSYT